MKRASLVRLFSILAVVAVVVSMAPPALSSDAYVNREGVTAPSPELAQAAGADAARMATRASLTTATLGVSQVVADSHGFTGALSAPNEAPAIETPAVAHQEGALTPETPPAAFGVAGEAAIDPDGREIEFAAGRLRLALAQAAPGASVRYQPLAAEETGSPFGIGFELSTEHGEKLSPSSAITLTLDYRDLAMPYRAAAESRLALFMQQPVDDQGTLAWRPLAGRVDLAGKTVTATAPGLGRFMLATTAAGDDGDFTLQPGGGMADYQVSLAMGSATASYSYDVLGQLAQVADAANNVTSMAYDPLGRKTAMTDPDMGSWSYIYDAVGNLTAQRDGRNQWLYFEYDALNRLVAKRQDSAAGPLLAEYLFDAAGQKGLLSRSKAYSAEGVVEIYNVTYDARNRLTQQKWIVPGSGGGTFRLDHSYNAADQPATLRYPGGTAGEQGEVVTTGFDALGQVNSVSGSGVSYVSSTTYNARGQVVEQRLDTGSNGLTRQYVYDQNTMRLTTLRAGVASPYTNLQNLSYTYDAVGNIASLVDGVNSSQRQCFGYDALDRLTNAFTGNSNCTAYATGGTGPYNHTYVYDAIGNLTSYAGNAYSYSAGKPHAVSAAYGNSYGYDGNGNQTTRTIAGTAYTFVFDYENRLIEVKQGSTTLATFLYDADGNRVKGTVSGVTTVYVAGIYEYQGGATTKYYEGGGLRRAGYSTNNGVFYMLSDHLKSTSALVARNGVLNVKYFYYPYGARRGVPFNTITTKHFTGQYHETSLPGGEGLSFYNARWYDPKLGSFLSADSIVPAPLAPQSLNRYAYVGGNPVNHRDPTGHACDDGPQTYAACYGNKPVSHAVMRAANTPGGRGTVTYSQVKSVNRTLTQQLPTTRSGFVWRPVNGGMPVRITAYITVLESDRAEYSGPLVSIPGLEGLAPDIPEGMLYDLYEEGSLKLKDGRYVQRDWHRSNETGRPIYGFMDPPPYAANGRVSAYATGAAHRDLIPYYPQPTTAYIVGLNLLIMVNDTGGGLGPAGPLDVYVGEGLAAERDFGSHYSEVFILVPHRGPAIQSNGAFQ